MAISFGNVIAGTIDRMVRWVVIPVTSVIPFLARTGVLLAAYGAMWLVFVVGLATDRGAVDHVSSVLTALPLAVQAVIWLLFLPLTAGLWVWGTDWPEALRLIVIAGLAGWTVLVLFPSRGPATGADGTTRNAQPNLGPWS